MAKLLTQSIRKTSFLSLSVSTTVASLTTLAIMIAPTQAASLVGSVAGSGDAVFDGSKVEFFDIEVEGNPGDAQGIFSKRAENPATTGASLSRQTGRINIWGDPR